MTALKTIADGAMPTTELGEARAEQVVVPFLESASRGLRLMLGLVEERELPVEDQSEDMADLLNAREVIIHFNQLFVEPVKIQV